MQGFVFALVSSALELPRSPNFGHTCVQDRFQFGHFRTSGTMAVRRVCSCGVERFGRAEVLVRRIISSSIVAAAYFPYIALHVILCLQTF